MRTYFIPAARFIAVHAEITCWLVYHLGVGGWNSAAVTAVELALDVYAGRYRKK